MLETQRPTPQPLLGCDLIGAAEIRGPEELEIDADGRVYAGTEDGTIVRVSPHQTSRVEVVARPGGRPNGLTFDPDGNLIVSDGYFAPASRVRPTGAVERLDMLRGGDTAVARDGTIYFSAPPDWKRSGEVNLDFLLLILEASTDGELRAYHPDSGTVEVLATGFYLPDGVALSASEDFVAVGEFGAYRVSRYWLRGPKAGTTDRLIENLPGSPDGLAADGAGRFYLAMPLRRNALLDRVHRHPHAKNLIARMLWLFAPTIPQSGTSLVAVVDEAGRVTRVFDDPSSLTGGLTTTAEPRDGSLYLGSLVGHGIARCPLPG
jgi:sugar lactone lactonase YvrE